MKLSGGRTIALGGDFPENICLGAIVLVEMSIGQLSGGVIVLGGNCLGGNCPGDNNLKVIVQGGNCPKTVIGTPKLDRVVTYRDGLLPIKSHSTFITWSWKIT